MSHTHQEGGPICPHRTRKVCDDAYADWQANSQVMLAAMVVAGGDARVKAYRQDDTAFGQLIKVIDGTKATLDGEAPFTRRLRSALARWRDKNNANVERPHDHRGAAGAVRDA